MYNKRLLGEYVCDALDAGKIDRDQAISILVTAGNGKMTEKGAVACIDIGAEFWHGYNNAFGMDPEDDPGT